ncbi:hypothetical protein T484DRAFT_1756243 [Baffinella frigidus]|nr:hypothetical protein T484DRAFT_1756243 [Cryptophyta sp. CCMP2293]
MTEHVSRTASPPPDVRPAVALTTSVKSESQGIVESFVLFCEKHGVDVNEYDSAMKLCILLSLGGVDTQGLCKAIIPNVFVDWTSIVPGMMVFGNNTVAWIDAMQFFTLSGDISSQQNATKHPGPSVLSTFTKLLEQSGISMPLEHVMRLFVLCSVTNQPMSAIVYQYTRLHHHPATKDTKSVATTGIRPETSASNAQAQTFVGKYVDNRVKFESDQCFEGMLWVLTNLVIREGFMKFVTYHNENRIRMQKRMQLKAKQMYTGRLRLRDRLNAIGPALQTRDKMFDDMFDTWCTKVRFPNNISLWLKQKLYFLRAQSFDVTDVVCSLVTEEVAKLVMENTVHSPEVAVIDAVIERLRFHSKPFAMMEAFHSEAFTGLSKTQIREIHNPMVMKLYVASYQKKNWRLHWCAILPESGMNHTIITHVERFVASHEVCKDSIIEMLRSS